MPGSPTSDVDGNVDRDPSDPGRGGGGRRLRILAVGDVFPWPARDGYRLRFASVVRALAEHADIDLFVAAFDGEGDVVEPPDCVVRHSVTVAPSARPSVGLVLRTIVSPWPRRILWREWEQARARLHQFAEEPYDLVWYSHADSYAALGDPRLGPAIVDLDNLENFVLRRPRRATPSRGARRTAPSPRAAARRMLKALLDWRDGFLWTLLQERIAREASAAVVCSELDGSRLKAARVAVVPNGYEDPGAPPDAATPAPAAPTSLVMVARFTYQPNLDGAEWFVDHVLPHLRRSVPDAQVRLVGRHDERLRAVASVPGVTIVGEVPEIGPELRGSRAAIVPLLSGSGTRIKVLEAFAYSLPVVTTRVGCEGLGVEPGTHALVCDDPAGFADACARVLTDDTLCSRLRGEGRRLYLEHFGSGAIASRINQLALSVVDPRHS